MQEHRSSAQGLPYKSTLSASFAINNTLTKLVINWVEKSNDNYYLKNVRQCVTPFKIKCINMESSMVWELAQYILCHPIPISLKCLL